jgi:hypothetical protein
MGKHLLATQEERESLDLLMALPGFIELLWMLFLITQQPAL